MQRFKAHVQNGRLLLDEPTDVPAGEEKELLRVDVVVGRTRYWFALDEDRRKLCESVGRSFDPTAANAAWHEPYVARSMSGRLVLDAPTDLADRIEVELVLHDDLLDAGGDWYDDEEHAQIRESIARSLEEAERGETVDADVVLAELRAMR